MTERISPDVSNGVRPRTAQERLIGRDPTIHLVAAIAEARSSLPAIIAEAEAGIAGFADFVRLSILLIRLALWSLVPLRFPWCLSVRGLKLD